MKLRVTLQVRDHDTGHIVVDIENLIEVAPPAPDAGPSNQAQMANQQAVEDFLADPKHPKNTPRFDPDSYRSLADV
jgi:hypothetical protein